MKNKNCFDCENCIYVLQGDYLCDMINEIVITEFSSPIEHFMECII